MEVVRQSHMVPKIGTVCNDFHFACCVNHTRLALANRCLQNSLWDRKPSPPNSKKKKENPHHPHVTKTLTPLATPSGPHSHLHKLLHVYAWHRLSRRQPLSSTPAAAARLLANSTAFHHFILPPPIAIDFLDAALY